MITKDNAAEFIPLLEALSEGKIIEVNNYGSNEWMPSQTLLFNHPDGANGYRIRQEPREWACVLSTNDQFLMDSRAIMIGDRQIIFVREILD